MTSGDSRITRAAGVKPTQAMTWEEAYLRFETPDQEIRKFQKRLVGLGARNWPRDARIAELFVGEAAACEPCVGSDSHGSLESIYRRPSRASAMNPATSSSGTAAGFRSRQAATTSSSPMAVCITSPTCRRTWIKSSVKSCGF